MIKFLFRIFHMVASNYGKMRAVGIFFFLVHNIIIEVVLKEFQSFLLNINFLIIKIKKKENSKLHFIFISNFIFNIHLQLHLHYPSYFSSSSFTSTSHIFSFRHKEHFDFSFLSPWPPPLFYSLSNHNSHFHYLTTITTFNPWPPWPPLPYID